MLLSQFFYLLLHRILSERLLKDYLPLVIRWSSSKAKLLRLGARLHLSHLHQLIQLVLCAHSDLGVAMFILYLLLWIEQNIIDSCAFKQILLVLYIKRLCLILLKILWSLCLIFVLTVIPPLINILDLLTLEFILDFFVVNWNSYFSMLFKRLFY